MAALSAHPFLFGLLFIFAAVELGLTAYKCVRASAVVPDRSQCAQIRPQRASARPSRCSPAQRYPSQEYQHRFRFLLFASVWSAAGLRVLG